MVSLLGPAWALAGAIVGTCEGLQRASNLLYSPSKETPKAGSALADLPALLEKIQLTHDSSPAASLPDACVLCCLAADAKLQAISTFVDAIFAIAIKRAAKTAAWAVEYARLCARFAAAAQPLRLQEAFAAALLGRALQEYVRMCGRTVALDAHGQSKHPDQVAAEAQELRGGLRFLAALLKEHLVPLALVHAAVADLAGRTAPGPASLHSQPMLALALASLLQGCVDAYVCDGVAGSGGGGKAAAAGAAEVGVLLQEAHIRAVGTALLRLQRCAKELPELKSELEDLHFKLTSYASTVFAASAHPQQQPQHAHSVPLPQPHFMPRRSEDLLWGHMRPAEHLGRWPSSQLQPN